MSKWKILIIVVLAIILLLGIAAAVYTFFTSDFYEEMRDLKTKTLSRFSYSRGGDMLGSHDAVEIRAYEDGRVIMRSSSSSWHGEDDRTTEYEVDPGILTELEKVFRKYHMNRWDGKKITNLFVADGASYSYSFLIGDSYFGFSSQIFDGRYRRGVDELWEVIDRFGETKKSLPGLLLPEKEEESDEWVPANRPTPGVAELRVYDYYGHTLFTRVLNGTEEELTYSLKFRLTNAETGEEISYKEPYRQDSVISPGYSDENDLVLGDFLAPGKYVLESGDLRTEFEIGQKP